MQTKKMRSLQLGSFKDLLEQNDRVGTMQTAWRSPGLLQDAYDSARTDTNLLCMAAFFVFLLGYMFATKSIAIPLAASYGVAGTYFWANLIYRFVFQFYWWSMPQQVCVFVVALVNTAHTLDMLEAWWAGASAATSNGHRLTGAFEHCWRSARVSNLISVLACCLFALSWSSAVTSTAVFLGCLICVETISLIVYSPAMMAFWAVELSRFNQACLGHPSGRPRTVQKKYAQLLWRRVVGHAWIRWLLIGLWAVGVCACGIIMAKDTQADENQPVTWASNNNYRRFHDWSLEYFDASDRDHSARMQIVWGLGEPDRVDCMHFELECNGQASYDDGFDLTAGVAQQQLYDFCDTLQGLDEATALNLKVRRATTGATTGLFRPLEVSCFIHDMLDYDTRAGRPYEYLEMKATLESLPTYTPAAYSSAGFFPPLANGQTSASCGDCDTYYRSFELGTLDWLSQGGDAGPVPNLAAFPKVIGGTADPFFVSDSSGGTEYAGRYGSTSRFAMFEVNLTFHSEEIDSGTALEVAKRWDAFLTASMMGQSRPLKNVLQTTAMDRTWSWAQLKQKLMPDLIMFLAISIAALFVVLCVATNNYVVATITTIATTAIVIFMLGIMGSRDWNLGLYESAIFVLVVPVISVLVTGYACYYTYSPCVDRERRAADALEENAFALITAPSLLFIASLFLLGSELQFYYEFGACLAILLSLGNVSASLVFPAILGIAGPQDDDYSLTSLSPWHNPRRLSLAGPVRTLGRVDTTKARPQPPVAADDDSDASDEVDFKVPPPAAMPRPPPALGRPPVTGRAPVVPRGMPPLGPAAS